MRPPHDPPSRPAPPPAGEMPATASTSPAALPPTSDLPSPGAGACAGIASALPAPSGRYELGEQIGGGLPRGPAGPAGLPARDPPSTLAARSAHRAWHDPRPAPGRSRSLHESER